MYLLSIWCFGFPVIGLCDNFSHRKFCWRLGETAWLPFPRAISKQQFPFFLPSWAWAFSKALFPLRDAWCLAQSLLLSSWTEILQDCSTLVCITFSLRSCSFHLVFDGSWLFQPPPSLQLGFFMDFSKPFLPDDFFQACLDGRLFQASPLGRLFPVLSSSLFS